MESFTEHNITIYGTWENPLFKAQEIGKMLGISRIRDTISKFNDSHVIKKAAGTTGGLQEQYFLTETGLYRLLYISKKQLAIDFCENVSKLLIEQRLQLGKELELKAKRALAQERERHLIDKHKNKPGVYFMKHLIEPIIKFGSASNITRRIKDHKRSFGKERIYLDNVVESERYVDLEDTVRSQSNTTFQDESGHEHTEIIRYNNESEVESVYKKVEACNKLIKPPEYDVELEKERLKVEESKERTKQKEYDMKRNESELEINREKTKQMELESRHKTKQMELESRHKTKQMELEIELYKLKNGIKSNHTEQSEQPELEQPEQPPSQRELVYKWCDENIIYHKGYILKPREAHNLYTQHNDISSNVFKAILKEYFEGRNVRFIKGTRGLNGKAHGYRNINLTNDKYTFD